MIFRNSVHTAKKTQRVSITETNSLILFKEVIAFCFENHVKPINSLCKETAELLIARNGGTQGCGTCGLKATCGLLGP
jgi:hypothetical protein